MQRWPRLLLLLQLLLLPSAAEPRSRKDTTRALERWLPWWGGPGPGLPPLPWWQVRLGLGQGQGPLLLPWWQGRLGLGQGPLLHPLWRQVQLGLGQVQLSWWPGRQGPDQGSQLP